MKHFLFILVMFMLVVGCGQNDPEAQKQYLEGYWEIASVEKPDGTVKEFQVNENIDYIKIEDSTGFRTKVIPRYDGKFTTTKDSEKLILKIEADTLRILYSTLYDDWKETVLNVSEDQLKIRNQNGIIYTYRRHKKFNLLEE
ncbi:MAG: lipocalin family protein [Leeuwenhoekiella sp.]